MISGIAIKFMWQWQFAKYYDVWGAWRPCIVSALEWLTRAVCRFNCSVIGGEEVLQPPCQEMNPCNPVRFSRGSEWEMLRIIPVDRIQICHKHMKACSLHARVSTPDCTTQLVSYINLGNKPLENVAEFQIFGDGGNKSKLLSRRNFGQITLGDALQPVAGLITRTGY
jgi:hypothetical protein